MYFIELQTAVSTHRCANVIRNSINVQMGISTPPERGQTIESPLELRKA